jgi:hypothetical protein
MGPRCHCRHQRRWLPNEAVGVTPCPSCRDAMSVVGIAFFDANGQALQARTPLAA